MGKLGRLILWKSLARPPSGSVKAGSTGLPSRYPARLSSGSEQLLKEDEAEEGLESLLPFLPLTKGGKNRKTVDEMFFELQARNRQDLFGLGFQAATLVLTGADLQQLIEEYPMLRDVFADTWLTQELIAKGREQAEAEVARLQEELAQARQQALEEADRILKAAEEERKIPSPEDNEHRRSSALLAFLLAQEASWKALKWILKFKKGIGARRMKPSLKEAFFQGWLGNDNQLWLQMVKDRNFVEHECNLEEAMNLLPRIKDYAIALRQAHDLLVTKYPNLQG